MSYFEKAINAGNFLNVGPGPGGMFSLNPGSYKFPFQFTLPSNIPPSFKGRRLKIYYCTQTGVAPIRIDCFVNDKRLIHFSYLRYLENQLRANFDLEGTPIEFNFKNRSDE